MAGPLLFALPAVGAVTSLGPRLAAEVIERGGDIRGGSNPPGIEATLKAEKLMNEMRQNARAIHLYKKTL